MTVPTRDFANDDDAAQHWLTVLREGAPDQKITARHELAGIFERRGMHAEAADLLNSNVRDGVRNADIFRWLARLHRAQGDEATAMQAAAEAAKYMPRVEPQPEPQSGPRETLARRAASRAYSAPAPSLPSAKPRPWYLRTATILLASSLCIPPLAIAFVWMRPWRRPLKIVATVPLAVWSLFWVIAVMSAMLSPKAPPPSSTASAPSSQPVAQAPGPVLAPTAKPEPTPRPATATPVPPTAPPTPTAPPDPAQAQYLDPRELVAEAKAHVGKNVLLQGKALNVEHHDEAKGILSTTPAYTWINLLAAVRGRPTTEGIVVELYPRDPKVLKDECYQIRGIVTGTQKVRRLLTGTENEVPVIRGYEWKTVAPGQFGVCPAP